MDQHEEAIWRIATCLPTRIGSVSQAVVKTQKLIDRAITSSSLPVRITDAAHNIASGCASAIDLAIIADEVHR
jgi:hypothetical protein